MRRFLAGASALALTIYAAPALAAMDTGAEVAALASHASDDAALRYAVFDHPTVPTENSTPPRIELGVTYGAGLAAVLTGSNAPPPRLQLAQLSLGVTNNAGSAAAPYNPLGVFFWDEAGANLKSTGNFNGGVDTRHGIVAFRRMLWLGTPTTQGSVFRSSGNFGTYGAGAGGCSLEGCLGWVINADNASWTVPGNGFTLRNTISATDSPTIGDAIQGLNYAFNFQWQSVVEIYDTNAAQNSRKVAIWVDGVYQGSYTDTQGAVGAYDVPWNTSRGVFINNAGHGSGIATGGALMMADNLVNTRDALPANCPANAATGACDAIVAGFYDKVNHKPVNPGTGAFDCVAFLATFSGTAMDWCLRGDKDHFLLNTGGTANVMAVTDDVPSTVRVVGTGAVLYNAPFGQDNEPADRPFRAWGGSVFSTGVVSSTSTTSCTGAKCTTNVLGNFGGSIKTGDRLFVIWSLDYTTGPPSTTLPTLSAGWSFVPSTTVTNPTNDVGSSQRDAYLVATHVATADYVGVNSDWVAGNPFQDPLIVTYDCIPHGACATAPKSVQFVMLNYRSLNGVVNINASDMNAINSVGGLSQTSAKAPSVTTTKAPATLISFCTGRSNARPLNPATGTDVVAIQPFGGAGTAIITVADEKLTAVGPTGIRQFLKNTTATTTDREFCGQIPLTNF